MVPRMYCSAFMSLYTNIVRIQMKESWYVLIALCHVYSSL